MKDTEVFEPVVSPGQVETVAALAAEIWREHYEGILSPDQIEYMVEQFQSASAVDGQIMEEGYRYWLIKADGQEAGYYGACPGEGGLFLSKLYIRRVFRGRRLASAAIERCREWCRREGYPHICLTVNKENRDSIAVYRHLGFEKVRDQVADIGGGYVMDDYVMQLPVPPEG